MPVYNEASEAGIAVGIDLSLSSSEKLRLHRVTTNLMGQNVHDVKKGCFTLVMCDLWDTLHRQSFSCCRNSHVWDLCWHPLGLIAKATESGDSVFAEFSAVDANEADAYFGAEVNKTKLLNDLSLAIVIKASW